MNIAVRNRNLFERGNLSNFKSCIKTFLAACKMSTIRSPIIEAINFICVFWFVYQWFDYFEGNKKEWFWVQNDKWTLEFQALSLTFICRLRKKKGWGGRKSNLFDWAFASFRSSRAAIFGIFCYFFVTPPYSTLLITPGSPLRRRLISNLSLSHPLTTSGECKHFKYLQVAEEWHVS